jgi:hypothetical protein
LFIHAWISRHTNIASTLRIKCWHGRRVAHGHAVVTSLVVMVMMVVITPVAMVAPMTITSRILSC